MVRAGRALITRVRPVYFTRVSVAGHWQMSPNSDRELEEFRAALAAYRKANRRPFPTLREYLAIAKSLGYAKPKE